MTDTDVEVEIGSPRIVIPEGKLEAPRDYSIGSVRIDLGRGPQTIDLIRQELTGRCAEFTALNTAIILNEAGIAINPAVEEYLNNNSGKDLTELAADLVVPMLLTAQEGYQGVASTEDDVDNLVTKVMDPYEALTYTNSVLLFRSFLDGKPTDFKPEDFTQTYTDEVDKRISDTEIIAIFAGLGAYARSYLKLGEKFYYVDPLSPDIVQVKTQDEAKNHMRETLNRSGSFITLNDLRVK